MFGRAVSQRPADFRAADGALWEAGMTLTIAFFGSPPEAVESLSVLKAGGFEIASVYTRPDRPAGRGNRLTPTAVKAWATERGLDVRTPADLRSRDAIRRLADTDADAFVVAAYGRILPSAVLDIPRFGVINIHPSLLPKYRGPAPVQTAILDGVPETGVTIMQLDEGMDTGMILRSSGAVPLDGTERTSELTARLFLLGARMLPGVLSDLSEGRLTPVPQDDSMASVTRLVRRGDGEVDWRRPARYVERMVRAYDPWPGVFTTWYARTLKILDASVVEDGPSQGPPGTVFLYGDGLAVATGEGALELHRVQLAGRRAADTPGFLNGHPEIVGAVLPS